MTALAPVETRINHLFEQGAGAIFAVVKALIEHFDRVENRIQPNQVRRFQWTHLMPKTALEELINLLRRGNLLVDQKDRFVDREHQHPIRDKAG